jgi:hypothetical protein
LSSPFSSSSFARVSPISEYSMILGFPFFKI